MQITTFFKIQRKFLVFLYKIIVILCVLENHTHTGAIDFQRTTTFCQANPDKTHKQKGQGTRKSCELWHLLCWQRTDKALKKSIPSQDMSISWFDLKSWILHKEGTHIINNQWSLFEGMSRIHKNSWKKMEMSSVVSAHNEPGTPWYSEITQKNSSYWAFKKKKK